MDLVEQVGKLANFARKKPDGNLFWMDGIYQGMDAEHYFFLDGDKMMIFPKEEIATIQFTNHTVSKKGGLGGKNG